VGGSRQLDKVATVTDLATRLGFGPDDRVLIVNADDLGLCHAANVGVFDALESGAATSATLMVPCPWARQAATRYQGEDIGVHLTLNAEYDRYRWGPITHAPSLLDGDGGFPRTREDLIDHADIAEARRECRAQIERAILWGFDVSHLDTHMGVLQLRPELFDIYLELAVDFDLPIRLSGASSERILGFPFRSLAEEEGVLFPDHLLHESGTTARELLDRHLDDLRPGVTELLAHPADDTAELRAFAPDADRRIDDHDVLDAALVDRVAAAGVTLIGYRALRDAQRAARSAD
jgi:predicted glycoside hydrolase/deacetylase ChbG (UPF0249 family)